MARKEKKTAAAKSTSTQDPEYVKALATVTLRPSANAAAVIAEYGQPFGEQSIDALIDSLAESMDSVNAGNMKRCETMLLGQAHALQSIFMNLSRRAAKQEYLKQWEAYLRMALKAQSQCRMTLETLATIKNPPVVFAKQANIANGPQQVNNGSQDFPNASRTPTHAENSGNRSNELSEVDHGQWLDTRTTGTAGSHDSAVAAMGEIDRAKDGGR